MVVRNRTQMAGKWQSMRMEQLIQQAIMESSLTFWFYLINLLFQQPMQIVFLHTLHVLKWASIWLSAMVQQWQTQMKFSLQLALQQLRAQSTMRTPRRMDIQVHYQMHFTLQLLPKARALLRLSRPDLSILLATVRLLLLHWTIRKWWSGLIKPMQLEVVSVGVNTMEARSRWEIPGIWPFLPRESLQAEIMGLLSLLVLLLLIFKHERHCMDGSCGLVGAFCAWFRLRLIAISKLYGNTIKWSIL